MATVKLATLVIRTVAKPISNRLKQQAKEHETFRTFCVGLAQRMYRAEVKLRTRILGEPAKHIRPLSEARAIENGANSIAEGFLFSVAAALIIGETWRTSRNQSKRRDDVDDKLEELEEKLVTMTKRLEDMTGLLGRVDEEKQRNDQLSRILQRVVEIGLRGGWADFQNDPDLPFTLSLPRVDMDHSLADHMQVKVDSSATPGEVDNSTSTPTPQPGADIPPDNWIDKSEDGSDVEEKRKS